MTRTPISKPTVMLPFLCCGTDQNSRRGQQY